MSVFLPFALVANLHLTIHRRAHANKVDLELDVLKLRLKRLETIALEFVPLAEQDILLDFEAYKDELLGVQTKQKQRRKKEDRWNIWRE